MIIGLLVVSMLIGKSQPKVAGILDFMLALLILFFRVIQGAADVFGWIFMILFFTGRTLFCFGHPLSLSASIPTCRELLKRGAPQALRSSTTAVSNLRLPSLPTYFLGKKIVLSFP